MDTHMLSRLFLSLLLIAGGACAQGPNPSALPANPSALPDGLILANDYKVIGPKSQQNMLADLIADRCSGCTAMFNDGFSLPNSWGGVPIDAWASAVIFNAAGVPSYRITIVVEQMYDGKCHDPEQVCIQKYGCQIADPRVYVEHLNGAPAVNWWGTFEVSGGLIPPTVDPQLHSSIPVLFDPFDQSGLIVDPNSNPDLGGGFGGPWNSYNCNSSRRYEVYFGNTPGGLPSELMVVFTLDCWKCRPNSFEEMFF